MINRKILLDVISNFISVFLYKYSDTNVSMIIIRSKYQYPKNKVLDCINASFPTRINSNKSNVLRFSVNLKYSKSITFKDTDKNVEI